MLSSGSQALSVETGEVSAEHAPTEPSAEEPDESGTPTFDSKLHESTDISTMFDDYSEMFDPYFEDGGAISDSDTSQATGMYTSSFFE